MYKYSDPPNRASARGRDLELLYQVIAGDQIEVYRQQNRTNTVDTRYVRAVDIALRYADPGGWRDI